MRDRTHTNGPLPDGACSTTLPSSARSPKSARHAARELLRGSCSEDDLRAVELLISELVTNAVVHAGTPCELRLSWRRGAVLRVEVTDGTGTTFTPPRATGTATSDPTARAGRGLVLVDALAARWGVTPALPTGKTVWFEIDL